MCRILRVVRLSMGGSVVTKQARYANLQWELVGSVFVPCTHVCVCV